MSLVKTQSGYPRTLRIKERDMLEFVLPSSSAGYTRYRELIASMVVLGEGRRGKGNLILGFQDDIPDTTSPLTPVVAYGVVETTRDQFTITVREHVGNQIDVEIVSSRGEEVPPHFEEKQRWTYSTWRPGEPSPATGHRVREVRVQENLRLAIAKEEERIWLYDGTAGMNILIPITNFHNELMLHKNIRDPDKALNARHLFRDLDTYSDDDLAQAFLAYNRVRPKVVLSTTEQVRKERGIRGFLKRLLVRKQESGKS